MVEFEGPQKEEEAPQFQDLDPGTVRIERPVEA